LVAFDEFSIKEKSQELYDLLLDINGIEDKEEVDHEYVLPQEAFAVSETAAEDDHPEVVHFIADQKFNNLNQEISHTNDVFYQQAKDLKPGEWIEFIDESDEEKNIRAKLSWISPISHKLLFVNARGVKVTDKSLDELAHDLREKQAVVLQQIPLFDRAMSAIAKQVVKEGDEAAQADPTNPSTTAPPTE